MKKIVIGIVALLLNCVAWGQSGVPGKYIIQSHVQIQPGNNTYGDGCSNSVQLDIIFNNTTKTIFYQDLNHIPSNAYTDFGIKYDSVDATSVPVSLQSTASRQWKRTWGGCGGNGSFTNSKTTKPITYCLNTYNNNNAVRWWKHMISIDIYPKLVIQPNVDNYLPVNDKISIYSNTGFRAQEYNWDYSLDGVTWVNLPQYAGQPAINISATDILGSAVTNYEGAKIYFRQQDLACSSNAISNIVFYTIILSAPHINGSTAVPVSCYDATDGSVILNFDRALLPEETLTGSLTAGGIAVNNPVLTDSLSNGTTYTITGLAPGAYTLNLMGNHNGNVTYTDGPLDSLTFTINRPTPVNFTVLSTANVYCYGGSDGVTQLSAAGGQNQYQYTVAGNNGTNIGWANFTSGTNTTIPSLPAGTYQIEVRDNHQCLAKNTDGNVKIDTVQITQPAAPVSLSETEVVQPTGYGLSNGYVSVRVTGGTPNAGGSYYYEWRKDSSTGTVITTGITTDAVNNPFTIKLGNIPAGNYYLTVKDANYAVANSALNSCGIIAQKYVVEQPQPLIASISVQAPISCNINNSYPYKLDLNHDGIPDEAQNGVLTTTVTGGVGNYTYQWQQLVNGSYQNMTGATAATLLQLQEGTYKILVTDANANATADSTVFNYPAQLQASLSATAVTCNDQSSGAMSVTATGGVSPYSYQWSTGDTTATVTGLPAGNYLAIVKDANNCVVNGTVNISQPQELTITDIAVQNPVCHGAANGIIQMQVSGGAIPYQIAWSNGMGGERISGLKSGTYTASVTDANGCTEIKTYNMVDPDSLAVNLGKGITLCEGDSATYDASITGPNATYRWMDGNGNLISTSASITLFNAGNYTVMVTDSNGCTGSGSVSIKNSSEVLTPQFMLATHAYVDYDVVLVNTSPVPPQQVQWILPSGSVDIQVIEETNNYLKLRFNKTGPYQFGLKGIQGQCEKVFYKNIVVEKDSTGAGAPPTAISNILSFTIAPNPNTGNYTVNVQLNNADAIRLKVISIAGAMPYPAVTQQAGTNFSVPFQQWLEPGMYLVVLQTSSEVQVKKMIVR